MKKWLALAAVAAMTLSLFGCGQNNNPSEVPTASTEDTTQAANPLSEKEYADFLTDEGYIKDLNAKECVSEADFTKLVVSKETLDSKTEEYVTGYMDYIAEHFSTQNKERAIEKDDLVNIDYSGSVDGVKFDGGTATDQQVTAGSTEFIGDFLTQIIGHKPGETMDVNVTFPDPYPNNTDLSGKAAVFVVTINYIYDTPELNDEYIAANRTAIEEYTKFENITDRKALEDAAYDYYYNYNLENLLYTALQEYDVVTTVPESAYNYAYVSMNKNYQASYGVSLDDLITYGYTEDEVKSMVESEAKIEILLEVVYTEEGYHVTEADLPEVTETTDNAEYIESYGIGYLCRYVMFNRAMEVLKGKVTIQ